MKKKFMENKKFRLITMLLITVLIVAGFSFAWFIMRTTDANQQLSVSNFQAEPECSFYGYEGDMGAYTDNDGLIVLSTNPGAVNYIGKLRINVKYRGEGSAYLRVKMAHEFSTGGFASQYTSYVPYTTEDNWYDNRGNDFCFYYKDVLKAESNETFESVSLLTGVDSDLIKEIAEGVEIKVAIETDMVQINRYPQLWGIDKLPWK